MVSALNKFMLKFLNFVEKVGNKFPHPFMIFIYLIVGLLIIAEMASFLGVSVVHPRTQETMKIKSFFSKDGVQFIFGDMITNFTSFYPLGVVLVLILGIGMAQKAGLLDAFMKRMILGAPKRVVPYAVVFTGIIGNLASDAAFVIIPPLAGMAFYALGRHPLAGMAAGFAGGGAGFTANIFVAGTDALLSGISTEVAKSIDETLVVTSVDNYFFMATSVVLLTFLGGLVTEKIIEPRLGEFKGTKAQDEFSISAIEKKGLLAAGISGFIYIGLVLCLILPGNSPLRNDDGGLIPSPFLSSIVPFIFLFFVVVSIAYGIKVKKIKTSADVPKLMTEAIMDISGYIVLVFVAAQFIAYFNWSNLGIWLGVNGAELLQDLHLTGLPVIVGFILLTAFLNLFIFGGSEKWLIMAPIFIPMLTIVNYHPAFIQLAYRIGDSSTNIITPLNVYVPMLLTFMKQYDHKAGFGTLLSLMMPYSIIFLFSWIVMFVLWSIAGLPIGPGVNQFLN
ncbi:aminobenzoyl-glutamate transport protein [Bacillus thermophilus]|uniref:Aminobenzoyl-glutamate transport protein n=1 Tax=Siminovitchia thermophila TaxID=1245522 RepID=A0ABS2R1B9_9BACI|nr:AbgT family transporter [Siminovitchia thermophila]MBM7713369.1 aminobenzoyl-glutamate transport protein [Siminovitchia thermophila]